MTKTEWAVRYEKPSEMRADGTVPTITTVVISQGVAEACVRNESPLSGKNHRVVHREVSEWVEE